MNQDRSVDRNEPSLEHRRGRPRYRRGRAVGRARFHARSPAVSAQEAAAGRRAPIPERRPRRAAGRTSVGRRRAPCASGRFRRASAVRAVAASLARARVAAGRRRSRLRGEPRRRARPTPQRATRFATSSRAWPTSSSRRISAEAATLLGVGAIDRDAIGDAAAALRARGALAVLLKGGHLDGDPVDALATADGVEFFTEPRIAGRMHGTGCTLAMALACELARGSRVARRRARRSRLRSRRNRKALKRVARLDVDAFRANAASLTRPRVMSGMRPTGPLHLGHLVGVLTQWANYCETADAFFEIADLHAYTTEFDDPATIRDARDDDGRASGSPPASIRSARRSFCNRACPEIAELQALLSMITPVSWLERVPTYKGQIEALGQKIATYGFLGYPLLQLCDIAVVARRVRAGRTRSGRAPRARARDRPPLQPPLRRRHGDLDRAATDAFGVSRSSRHRRAQDEQVLRQRDPHRRRRRDDDAQGSRDGHRSAESPARRSGAPGDLPGLCTLALRQSAAARRHRGRMPLGRARLRCKTRPISPSSSTQYLRPVRERYAAHMREIGRARRTHHRRRNRACTRDRRRRIADVKHAMRLT